MLDTAALLGLIRPPIALPLLAKNLGELAGILVAYYALPEYVDPNSSYGRLIRALFNLPPPPRARDFCTQAVNCDCENIGADLLSGPWSKECREREAAMIGKCHQSFQNGSSARGAVAAAAIAPAEPEAFMIRTTRRGFRGLRT